MATPTDKLAVLIDADDSQATLLSDLLAEVSRSGTVTIRRAYGDWTEPQMRNLKDIFQSLAIEPIQQFRFPTGKNATDAALVIDAMDILHEGAVGGICIVSSDAAYARLAGRIREAGLVVYGVGVAATPQSFVTACDKFIFTEALRRDPAPSNSAPESPVALKVILKAAIGAAALENGWAPLGAVALLIGKNAKSFDPRNFGSQKLSELVRKQPFLEVKEVPVGEGSPHVQLFVRLKGG